MRRETGWQSRVCETLATSEMRIYTAGAYVRVGEFYPFAIGIRPHNGNIPVVRLGGHREGKETGWQCAQREVYEETGLCIRPLATATTYVVDWEHLDDPFTEIHWERVPGQEPAPVLVVAYHKPDGISLSLMYLAQADGLPTPSSEIKGLVLLDRATIDRLCRESLTLAQYLASGGQAILKGKFDRRMVLEPFAQLRLLARMFACQGGVFE